METSRYIVGIDLGTTTCCVFYIDTLEENPSPKNFAINQWEDLGRTISFSRLPAFCYLPQKKDINKNKFTLEYYPPRTEPTNYAVGHIAQKQQVIYPERVIHSAKSWLSCQSVDRTANILPWGSEIINGEKKLSPVTVLSYYLSHIKYTWDQEFGKLDSNYQLKNQKIIITVPASYDLAATDLTLQSAKQAGFPIDNLQLLEEPQAAFYSWLCEYNNNEIKSKQFLSLKSQEIYNLLVCDIGGGTCDFSLFTIEKTDRDFKCKRIKVGEHILLGGDNIDLALANYLDKDKKLKPRQWSQLIGSLRNLKEKALRDLSDKDQSYKISIADESSNIFSSLKSYTITRNEIKKIIIDGFFPECEKQEFPQEKVSAITELGLNYAQDSAITRHLAQFLQGHIVDCILFAGGTLIPIFLQKRIKNIIEKWQDKKIETCLATDLDLSIGRGASVYGLHCCGNHIGVESNSPYSLYIKTKYKQSDKFICLLRKDSKSTKNTINNLNLKLTLGQPVCFEVFYTKQDNNHQVGDVLELTQVSHLQALPPLQSKLRSKVKQKLVEINLQIEKTPTGILNLFCTDIKNNQSWKLDFNLSFTKTNSRSVEGKSYTSLNQEQLEKIEKILFDIFLGNNLEKIKKLSNYIKLIEDVVCLNRSEWDLITLRKIFDLALKFIHKRGKDVSTESFCYNLLGYLGRPGFGHSQDSQRLEKLWNIYQQGIINKKSQQVENQWWILWRRLSGGLNKEQQNKIFQKLYPKTRKEQASVEELLLLGSLERIDSTKKISLGNALSNQIDLSSSNRSQKIWALTRISTRTLLYASTENIILPAFIKPWLENISNLFKHKNQQQQIVRFLLHSLKIVEDRNFDFDDKTRNIYLHKLKEMRIDENELKPLQEYVTYERKQHDQLFGEELPAGLILG
jgi:molecular chaperone DnaK (HSP70)